MKSLFFLGNIGCLAPVIGRSYSLNVLDKGPVYTECQYQCCDNSAMTLVILFSLKTMELLQIGVATHFQVTPIIFNENSTTSVIAQAALFTSFMKLVTGWRVGARNDV